jgi:hypothetical protein
MGLGGTAVDATAIKPMPPNKPRGATCVGSAHWFWHAPRQIQGCAMKSCAPRNARLSALPPPGRARNGAMRRSHGAVSAANKAGDRANFQKISNHRLRAQGQKADAKVHLICPHGRGKSVCTFVRAACLAGQNRVRAKVDFLRQFKLIWVSGPDAKIFSFRKPEIFADTRARDKPLKPTRRECRLIAAYL